MRGKIVIEKETIGGDGNFDFTADFNFDGSGPDGNTGTTTQLSNGEMDMSVLLVPGTYNVDETGLPSNWDISDITCVDASGGTTTTATGADVDLAAGDTVTCTFENTLNGGITIIKDTVPNGPQDFVFTQDVDNTG